MQQSISTIPIVLTFPIYLLSASDPSLPYVLFQELHIKANSEVKSNQIKGMSVTPISDERLVVTLSSNMIYSTKLKTDTTQFVSEQE
jgi:hypothetical protein